MKLRFAAMTAVALSCAGCAETTFEPLGHAAGSMHVISPASASEAIPRKTLSDKVLAAIALEAVTGLKPDPSRLLEAN